MAEVLLIDVRTPSHVYIVTQIFLKGDLDTYKRLIVIAPATLSVPEWPAELIKYSFLPSSYASLLKIKSLTRRVEDHARGTKSFDFLSAVNFGPLYDALRARLQFQTQLLFEDGISSYLNLKINFRWLKFILITAIFGKSAKISKAKFFSGCDEFTGVIYTDKPLLVRSMGLSVKVRLLPSEWSAADKKEKAIYLLSSSSVEYGLCSLEKYKEIMRRVSETYAGQPIIVSFHHNESQAITKLNIIKSLFQVERVIERGTAVEVDMNESGKMIEIIAPFNSVALNLVNSGRVIRMSLYDDSGPNIELRKEFFRKLNLVSELEIDIYE
jgi:hypothetical protein